MIKPNRLVPFLICISLLINVSHTSAQFETPPRRYGFVVFNSNGIRIDPGKSLLYSFHVAAYLVHARLAGNILAQGGSGDDIRVLVYRNQRAIFDSNQRRSIILSISIDEPGDYTLVLSNAFSVISAKIARGYVNLLYDGVDTERARTEKKNMILRANFAQSILDKLYAALRRAERELGTFQVPSEPRIVAKIDEELNASAVSQANIIFVNRGTFELAESYGDKQEDILAGVIAHELAHIFYKHQRGRSTGIGIWDELVGVLPLDRMQEREADVLGVRVACHAGFNPTGLLMFMEGIIAQQGNRSNFGSGHPATSERVEYLRQEVRRCEAARSRR